jgi:hypothetical protein
LTVTAAGERGQDHSTCLGELTRAQQRQCRWIRTTGHTGNPGEKRDRARPSINLRVCSDSSRHWRALRGAGECLPGPVVQVGTAPCLHAIQPVGSLRGEATHGPTKSRSWAQSSHGGLPFTEMGRTVTLLGHRMTREVGVWTGTCREKVGRAGRETGIVSSKLDKQRRSDTS